MPDSGYAALLEPRAEEGEKPTAEDRYYLVVPINFNGEGSYGTDSANNERPTGTSTCVPTQLLAPCP